MSVRSALILGVCVVIAAIAASLVVRSRVGHYQIVQRESNVIVVIDSETGRCWENLPGGQWHELAELPVGTARP